MKVAVRNSLMKGLLGVGVAVFCLIAWAGSGMAAENRNLTNRTFIDLIKKSKPACLNLTCMGRAFGSVSQGSGFVVRDEKGNFWVITNKHVVEGAVVIKAEGDNGNNQEMILEVVRISHQADLAILKIVSCRDKGLIKSIALADSDRAEEGEWVLAIGNPYGQSGTSSVGIISKIGRELSFPNFFYPHRFFQMNMSVNPGNSGGPLINLDGQVTGVIVVKGAEGISFAIPSNLVREEMIALVVRGGADIKPGWLGLVVGAADADTLVCFGHPADLKGLLVTSVHPDGPAGMAGLAQGDLITRINGEEVITDPAHPNLDKERMERKILNIPPGEKVTLTVISPGQAPREVGLKVAAKE